MGIFLIFVAGCSIFERVPKPRFSKEESIELDQANWNMVYDGGGRVLFGKNSVSLQSGTPRNDQEMTAALVVSRFIPRESNYRLRIRFKVESQLRNGDSPMGVAPRPWEVFWLFWDYHAGKVPTLKETKYFILKPNGVELGRAFGETDQVFWATADAPKLELRKSHEIILMRLRNQVSIEVDGRPALYFSDPSHSPLGRLGLYVEDAAAVVQSMWISYPQKTTSSL